jgi:membrane protease YdiL (CAAX protease family)
MNTCIETTLDQDKKFSVFGTIFWMLFLAFGIQGLVCIVAGIVLTFSGVEVKNIELAFLRPDLLAGTLIISAIIFIPFLKKAANHSAKSFPFQFLAIKAIDKTIMVKVLLLGLAYYILESALAFWFAIDTPAFMLDVKSQVNGGLDLLLLIISACIIAPIFEELIFRGLAFARIERSKLGIVGAIFITSIIFTLIHVQYEPMVLGFLFIFALLLGFIRYKTQNIVYCIALHALINSLSTFDLFVFL